MHTVAYALWYRIEIKLTKKYTCTKITDFIAVHLLVHWLFFDWFPTFTLLPLAGLGLLSLYGGGWFTGITLPVEVLSDDSKLVLLARGQTLNVVEGHSIQKKIIIFYYTK